MKEKIWLRNKFEISHEKKKCEKTANIVTQCSSKIHGIDQIKEKHCEDDEQIIFKCKDCDLTFDYKRSLALHRKTKHEEKIMHECKFCESKFTYKKNLTKHVKLKHKK